jgi:hypothetical protein
MIDLIGSAIKQNLSKIFSIKGGETEPSKLGL